MSSVSVDPQVAVFNSYFGFAEGTRNPQEQAFSAGIKESVLTFYNVLGVSFAPPAFDGGHPPVAAPLPSQYPAQYSSQAPASYSQQIHVHNHHHNCSTLDNPFFWLWIGSRQPSYRTYHHRSVRSDLGTRAGRIMEVAGVSRKDNKKNEDEAKKKIFLMAMCLALADIIATVAAIYVTVIAVKQANDASTQKNKFNQIAHAMQPTVTFTGQLQDDPTPHLQAIGKNLKEIGNREAKCSKYRAISIACLATAGVGAVHVACSAIACAIITGSASLSASSSGIAALAFFSASCAPPVLLAVATIAAVGTVIYLALQVYNKKAKDRLNAQDGLAHLNALTQLALNQAPPAYNYVTPSAPPLPGYASQAYPTPSAPNEPPPAYQPSADVPTAKTHAP
jgi:flagellar basal body-associated protein FliL